MQNRPTEQPSHDPDLALIIDRWPTLPVHLKAAVTAIIKSDIESD